MEAIMTLATHTNAEVIIDDDSTAAGAVRELSSLDLALVGGGLAVASFG
jgi:hypothetical protein